MTTESTHEEHRRQSDISLKMAKRIRISGTLILLGLGVEVITLLWSNPTAFIVYVGVGGLFLALGMAAYLFSLVFTH